MWPFQELLTSYHSNCGGKQSRGQRPVTNLRPLAVVVGSVIPSMKLVVPRSW